VRTELGIDRVLIRPPDTTIGSAGSSSASRQTMMTGGAVQLACQAVRAEIDAQGGMQQVRRPIEASRVFHHRPTGKLDANGQGDPPFSFALGPPPGSSEVAPVLGRARLSRMPSPRMSAARSIRRASRARSRAAAPRALAWR